MRRLAALMVPAALMLTASPVWADDSVETKPAEPVEEGQVDPAYRGDLFVSFNTVKLDGEVLSRVPRGRTSTLVFDVYNSFDDQVTDVTVRFSGAEGISFPLDEASLRHMDSYGNAQIEVQVRVEETSACADDAEVPFTVSSSRGSSEGTAWLPIACPGPRLYQSMVEYVGGDDDGQPEPGERLEVWVTYGNWGVDPATNVRGTLSIDSEYVTVVTDTATWPDIAPDGREGSPGTKARTPFVIEIAADAPTSDNGCGGYVGGPVVDDGGSTGSGSAGSAGGTEPVVTTIQPMPADEPQSDPDAPVSSSEETREMPAPMPPDGEYVEPEPIVVFQGTLHLETAETTQDDFIGSTMVCALADGAAGGSVRDSGAVGAPEAPMPGDDGVDLSATATGAKEPAGSRSMTASLIAAFLAGIATAGWFIARRRVLARAGASTNDE